MKHIVCYSGGHSSGLVALNVAHKFGTENLVLLNHNINPTREPKDVKRFKFELSQHIGVPITYANHPNWNTVTPISVCVSAKAFKVRNGGELCTNRLKTAPFERWLQANVADKNCIIYYGFDKNETVRIQRRSSILGQLGYKTDYPLALWNDLQYTSSLDVGIAPPNTYDTFKHANCTGCLKAGKQHWYIVYCTRRDIFEEAKAAEDLIGHSILKDVYMEEIEPVFAQMLAAGVATTEHEDPRTFFARVKKYLAEQDNDSKPCECVF